MFSPIILTGGLTQRPILVKELPPRKRPLCARRINTQSPPCWFYVWNHSPFPINCRKSIRIEDRYDISPIALGGLRFAIADVTAGGFACFAFMLNMCTRVFIYNRYKSLVCLFMSVWICRWAQVRFTELHSDAQMQALVMTLKLHAFHISFSH